MKQTIFYVYVYIYTFTIYLKTVIIYSNKLSSTNKGRHKFKSAIHCQPINKLYEHIGSLSLSFIREKKKGNGIL